MANKRDKRPTREGEPSQRTNKGLEIPVPKAEEGLALHNDELVSVKLVSKAPVSSAGLFISLSFAGTLEVSRPGLEPGT
jgi:hypothetical protein